MTARDWESRIALAMLPLGALLTLAGLFAAPALVGLLIASAWMPDASALDLLWCGVAGAVAAYVMRKGIETMSTFDWRVAVAPVAATLAVAVSWPGWWS